MEYFINEITPEKALLVGVDLGDDDIEASVNELEELSLTAGAEVIAKVIQKRSSYDSATCIGSGRLKEIADFCKENSVDLIIFDNELSPSQQRNIENETDIRTIDRTLLILDIFAARAFSKEGKLQVELAQLKYRLPRLSGKGIEMSRLGGGIGTRGPGESKLESDRRHIRRRIEALEQSLLEVEKHRKGLRERRKKTGVTTVSIVGYTNAGKSTIMNYLTDANVLSENKLFATLDPTSRALKLPDGREVMLIDTVGLIRNLPHQLIDAFKSTLEEATSADLILHVVDGSSEESATHFKVTEELLKELGCNLDKTLVVINKCDLTGGSPEFPEINNAVRISAVTGEGINNMLIKIQETLSKDRKRLKLLFPFDKAGLISKIRQDGVIFSEEYLEDGIQVDAIVDIKLFSEINQYII